MARDPMGKRGGGISESRRWTDRFLVEMRELGEPPADAVVAELFASGEVGAVNRLMNTLIANDGAPPPNCTRRVRDYLDNTDDLPPWADAYSFEPGVRLFERHGPACYMALACPSL